MNIKDKIVEIYVICYLMSLWKNIDGFNSNKNIV